MVTPRTLRVFPAGRIQIAEGVLFGRAGNLGANNGHVERRFERWLERRRIERSCVVGATRVQRQYRASRERMLRLPF